MSFFFKSSKKGQPPSGLPQATRAIKSSDGTSAPVSSFSTVVSSGRPETRPRSPTSSGGPVQSIQQLDKIASEKQVLPGQEESLVTQNQPQPSKTPSPEHKMNRDRSDSDARATLPSRIAQPTAPNRLAPDPSPYPWSQRQLTYSVPHSYPFPRYGAAVNAVASRDGVVYVMGGLVNGSTVKGDLWMIEARAGSLTCHPVQTTSEGPGPRVGHASLLVGNAFIVFGGDTKTEESDLLDDTLYLLNTSTKQWSRAAPAGPRPPGRYGHTLNILGSKIYIFGGQVEGFFFNDLVAFDLNALQQSSNQWEVLIQNTIDGGPPHGQIPPARTNHTIITWNEKLYLFGGTDGVVWFNDVWCYDPRTNSWSPLECIGYIPTAREGHAAALVGDVMYIFGGRTEEGNDLGDLAAFKITSRRWYTFQNMGPSPSPRSGHSMTAIGKSIIVLAGEPSSAPRDAGELSLAYFLDTTKIRYPQENTAPPQQQVPSSQQAPVGHRRPSGEKSGIPQSKLAAPRQLESSPSQQMLAEAPPAYNQGRPQDTGANGSRLPVSASMQQQQINGYPQSNGTFPLQSNGGPTPPLQNYVNGERTASPSQPRGPGDITAAAQALGRSYSQQGEHEVGRSAGQEHASKSSLESNQEQAAINPPRSASRQKRHPTEEAAEAAPRASADSSQRERPSIDRPSAERGISVGRQDDPRQDIRMPQIDSGLGSSPALIHQNDLLLKQLEAERSRNAWFTSELALARKAGYSTSGSSSTLDEVRPNTVGDDEKPFLEAMLKMRSELVRMQAALDARGKAMAEQIAHVEKQRDYAVTEATHAKARLAASVGEGADVQVNGVADRSGDLRKRLAETIAAQTETLKRVEALSRERDEEKQAREVAEEAAESSQKRFADLESDRRRGALELESLRAELHEAQRVAREEAANAAEATSAHKMLALDRGDVHERLETAMTRSREHDNLMSTLRSAMNASAEKAGYLEKKLEDEKAGRSRLESKLAQLRSQHEERTSELEATARQLRDAEELAERHANEAKTHRLAVFEGFSKVQTARSGDRGINDERISVLEQQIDNANALVRKNQAAADVASEKLRRAEERIAGLEAYQEQTSREGLGIRKQMQAAMKEVRSVNEEKARLQQQLQSHQLEANAINVQHSALKDILAERGINPGEIRKHRLNDSPSFNRNGASTPDSPRLRDLQEQLNSSAKAQEDLRSRLEDFQERDAATRREYEEKLTALDSDHQAAAKYLRGTEKMLSKMKQELQRVKQQSAEYLEELESLRNKQQNGGADRGGVADWEHERSQLHSEIESTKASLTTSMAPLEAQIAALQTDLKSRDTDLQTLRSAHTTHTTDLESLRLAHSTSQADIDRLRVENSQLEARAQDAEQKVQMLLDQVEHSVDNYRRQTGSMSMNGHVPGSHGGGDVSSRPTSMASISTAQLVESPQRPGPGGKTAAHTRDQSLGADSVYSEHDPPSEATTDERDGNTPTRTTYHRTSAALNSLADELDGLRYRLSGRFEFEKTPTTSNSVPNSAGGLSEWRRGLERDSVDSSVYQHPLPDKEVDDPATAAAKTAAHAANQTHAHGHDVVT